MTKLLDKYTDVKEEYIYIKLKEEDLYSGDLILVNKDNEFKQREIELISVDSSYFQIYGELPIYINKVMREPILNLIDAIDGRKKMVAVSGFRSKEEQVEIHNNSIHKNGIEFTRKYVARPNESEHQTGLAIDLGEVVDNVDFICPSFPDYGVCKEFKDLAASYGFIMRYKVDKENITGISEEKWHFRYVGNPHAQLINKYNYCLEEYIDFIREFKFMEKSLSIIDRNMKIEIFFIEKIQSITEIMLPTNKKYHISGNNVDGFIITIFEEMEA